MGKNEIQRFEVVEFATQTEKSIQDNELKDATGKPIMHDSFSAIVKIMNDIEIIKKSL